MRLLSKIEDWCRLAWPGFLSLTVFRESHPPFARFEWQMQYQPVEEAVIHNAQSFEVEMMPFADFREELRIVVRQIDDRFDDQLAHRASQRMVSLVAVDVVARSGGLEAAAI